MSHNLYTINNEGANVVSYHGFNDGVIYIGRGETASYVGDLTGGTGDATDDAYAFEWYDSNPINTISGASFTKRSGTNWIQKITLPAGTYWIEYASLVPGTQPGSSYGRGILNFVIDGASPSTVGQFYTQQQSKELLQQGLDMYPMHAGKLQVYASTTTFFVTVYKSDRTLSDTGNRISQCSYMFIRKLA